jgi:hypothetical protein
MKASMPTSKMVCHLNLGTLTNLNEIPAQPSELAVISSAQLGGGTSPEVQYELNGRIAVKITFGWFAPQGIKKFRVKYRYEDDNFTTVTVQGTTFDILDAKTGNYQIQVSSISSTGILFSEPALADYTVAGLGAAPSDVRETSAELPLVRIWSSSLGNRHQNLMCRSVAASSFATIHGLWQVLNGTAAMTWCKQLLVAPRKSKCRCCLAPTS